MPIHHYDNAPDPTTHLEFEWGENYEYMIDAVVEWSFQGHDGIGSYEYWGQQGYDEGSPVWEIESVVFTVWDENSNEVKLPDDMHADILQQIYEVAEPNFD
jgi:hypothetical protein